MPRLTFFTSFALRAAKALGIPTSNVVSLPTRTTLFTVPRSPFAHKKSQENFWRKEHKRAIKVFDANEDIVDAWLAYLRNQAMGGVGMKAQVFTYRKLGWAAASTKADKKADKQLSGAPSDDASTSAKALDKDDLGLESDRAKVENMAKKLEEEILQGLQEPSTGSNDSSGQK